MSETLDIIVEKALPALGGSVCMVSLLSPDGTCFENVRIVGFGPNASVSCPTYPADGKYPIADAVRSNTPVYLASLEERNAAYTHLSHVRSDGDASFVAMPLRVGDRSIGGLGIGFATEQAFSESERLFMNTIAAQCALALDGAMLHDALRASLAEARREVEIREELAAELEAAYHEEHRIADSLQRTLLRLPAGESYPDLEIESLYRPAYDEASVGGDYYDVIALEHGRVGLVVGDVSGKGLDAASRTAELKFTLRAYLREFAYPANALTRLNTFLIEAGILESDMREYFVCLALVVLDPSSGDASVAVAGSDPPIIMRYATAASQARVDRPEIQGVPLGIQQAGADYKNATFRLDPGDILILSTDGVTEARRGTSFFGNEGIVEHAASHPADAPLVDVGRAILDAAESFVGGRLRDDACLLLARRRAPSTPQ